MYLLPGRTIINTAVEDKLSEKSIQFIILDKSLIMKAQTLINKSKFLLQQKVVTKIPAWVVPPLPLTADIFLKLIEDFVVRL